MASLDELLVGAIQTMSPRPADDASQAAKKAYSESLSAKLAMAFAEHLRNCGLEDARPAPPGVLGGSGVERRVSGGIGAKKVDVTWATPESGLILAISIKTINSRDQRTGNFQKNLINRRGDMLMEAVTLHRRFPYAVLCGIMFLDIAATSDGTSRRQSTFINAHTRLKLFTGRNDPAGRDEQFERLYLATFDAANLSGPFQFFAVGDPTIRISTVTMTTELLDLVAIRNSDLYSLIDNRLIRQR